MEVQRPVSMAPGLGVDGFFTEADLAAADQLVQLSISGGAAAPTSSSRSARSVNNTEIAAATRMADQLVQLSVSGGAVVASPTSSSLSARSVNNTEPAASKREDDDDDGMLDRRARKRYRRVAELYHATRPAKRGGVGGKRRREDRRDQRQIDRRSSWVCV